MNDRNDVSIIARRQRGGLSIMAEYAETRRDERASPPPVQRRPTQAARATPSSAARVLGLQASAGNRAVAAMLQRTAPPRAPAAAPEVGTTSTAGAPGRDLDQPPHPAPDERPIGAADDDRVDRPERSAAATDPHTTKVEDDVPIGDATGAADFPYETDKAKSQGRIVITRVGDAAEFLPEIRPIPAWGDDPSTGYVVNIVGMPQEIASDIATRYLDEGWSGAGAGADNVAASRTAVVVGVNRSRSVDPAVDQKADSAVRAAVSRVAHDGKLLMAAFGFMWTPAWKNTKTGDPATLDEVRQAADTSDAARQQALQQESGLRDSGALPYGALREEVLGSSYTRKAVDILQKVNQQVHVVSQDTDGKPTAASGKGILAAYDEILSDMARHPHMVIGGYTFEGFNWGTDAHSRTTQLTVLANQLDRAIRAVIGRRDPRVLYPTEPSSLIKVWDKADRDGIFQIPKIRDALDQQGSSYKRGSFYGLGASEGRTARESIAKAVGHQNLRVVHDPRAAVTTSPAPSDPTRGLTVTEEDVRAHAAGQRPPGTKVAESRHRMYAIIMQSQSQASARRLAHEFRTSNPHLASRDQTRMAQDIFRAVEDICLMLADNPALTADSEQVKARVTQLDQAALTARRGRSQNTQAALQSAHDLTKDIITAMTADQLRVFWTQLSALLAEITSSAGGNQETDEQ